MRKMFLVLFMIFALNGMAYGTDINTFIPTNTNVNTPVDTNLNTFVPTNLNSNIQGQQQGQGQVQGQMQGQGQLQGQKQGQNNKQTIAPVQKVLFEAPTPLLGSPSQMVPELNFGTGRMKDVTSLMPNFALYGIKKYGGEPILDVPIVDANVKFKNYYRATITHAKDLASEKGFKSENYRVQVICAEAQKTWQLGANAVGAGSGLASSGLGGGSGMGGFGPTWAGTKADDLFTIIFFKVAL
jgi:hypothetical protein